MASSPNDPPPTASSSPPITPQMAAVSTEIGSYGAIASNKKLTVEDKLRMLRERYDEYCIEKKKREDELKAIELQNSIANNPNIARLLKEPTPWEVFTPRNIQNLNRRVRCGFRLAKLDPETQIPQDLTSIIGSPHADPEDYQAFVRYDAGRYGDGRVTITFKIRKRVANENIIDTSESASFMLYCTFKLGAKLRDTGYQIDCFDYKHFNELELGDELYDERMDKEIKPGDTFTRPHLHCCMFISHGCVQSHYDPQSTAHLPQDVQDVLRKLFCDTGTFRVVCYHPIPQSAEANWLKALRHNINHHTPQLWQYLNEDGSVNYSLDQPLIVRMQEGMYVKENGEFYTFPENLDWDELHVFAIDAMIPAIREYQLALCHGQIISQTRHRAYAQQMPQHLIDFRDETGRHDRLSRTINLFVTLTQFEDFLVKEMKPAAGSRVLVWWDKPHDFIPNSSTKNGTNYGVVVDDEEGCLATGAAFCLRVSLSKSGSKNPPRQMSEGLQKLSLKKLNYIHIYVEVDTTAIQRQLLAISVLCKPKDQMTSEEIDESQEWDEVMNTLCQKPGKKPKEYRIDLTAINPEAFSTWYEVGSEIVKDSPDQLAIIDSLENVDSKLVGVLGAAGTGKTNIMALLAGAVGVQGAQVMITGTTHAALDTSGRAVWKWLSKDARRVLRFLRMDLVSVEIYHLQQSVEWLGSDALEPKGAWKQRIGISENGETSFTFCLASMTQAAAQIFEPRDILDEAEYDELFDDLELIENQEPKTQTFGTGKESKLPRVMTLAWREWELLDRDSRRAQEAFENLHEAWTSPEKTEEECLESNPRMSDRLKEAWQSEPIREEEFNRRVRDHEIENVEQLNKSHGYRTLLWDFVQDLSSFNSQKFKALIKARMEVIGRILHLTTFLLVTCNKSAMPEIKTHFKAQVVLVEEAAQMKLSDFMTVVYSQPDADAYYLFGDPKQLIPYNGALLVNEKISQSKRSPLSLLEVKNHNIKRLTKQYRAAPALMQFPNRYFYNNTVENAAKTFGNNNYRVKTRELSQRYRIGKTTGSELFFIDVPYGASRAEEKGTSLTNPAEAIRVAKLVDQYLQMGVPIGKITILCYYNAQRDTIKEELTSLKETLGRAWQVQDILITSVDQYQNLENEITIVNFVAAPSVDRSETENRDDGSEAYSGGCSITSYVKDKHRLLTAITRAKNGCVLIGNMTALLWSTQKESAPSAVFELMLDLFCRNLVAVDKRSKDQLFQDNPKLTEQRTAQAVARLDQALKRKSKPKVEGDVYAAPTYRLREGRTQRPIDTGSYGMEADEYDEEGTI
ncbi:uncharacterized protein KY384_008120 [Bacidia gigantensis]|uniref:uncharacterized protein n=1 Tax=Bacidia gigantensis TaxID=2732470 RepID=UPI001D05540B|nr:uncharacterized protein KY384_008120 [Bacidia gigantensis]KAG8526691.1 hypothetical protein KY384_008120 [Bacidia gigantensis]